MESAGVWPEENRVDEGGRQQGQGGGAGGAHQGDEQIQLGDGGGQADWNGRNSQVGQKTRLGLENGNVIPEGRRKDPEKHVSPG